MDLVHFWQLVAETKQQSEGDCDTQAELLRAKLKRLPADEIITFFDLYLLLRELLYRADFRSAYYIISGSGSEDGFMDFGDWVISRGFDVYRRALRDVETLADIVSSPYDDVECEDFGSAALIAYEEKTGEEMPERPHFSVDSDKIDWDDEAKMEKKYPRLWAKYEEVNKLPEIENPRQEKQPSCGRHNF